MKWKNVLFVVVLNIFIMVSITVIQEYNDMSERIQNAADNINYALDTAIEGATATEELFTKSNSTDSSSVIMSSYSSGDNGEATMIVWDKENSTWYCGNNYLLSMYYWSHGQKFPTEAEYNTFASNNKDVYKIWSWLYGSSSGSSLEEQWANLNHKGLGQAYTNLEYTTLCRNVNTRNSYLNPSSTKLRNMFTANEDSNRQPSKAISEFYDNIGKNITSKYSFKRSTGDRFTIEEREAPTLLKMGLVFNGSDIYTSSHGATYIDDDMISSVKLGKKKIGKSYTDSLYFYSPYSLGITYVPVEVLKPMFLYNLDTKVRLGIADTTGVSGSTNTSNDFNLATGCLDTSVYVGGGSTSQNHVNTTGSTIINDGLVEYDLDSAKVKVDYFCVNAYSDNVFRLMNELNGALTATTREGVDGTGDAFIMKNIGTLIKKHETGSNLANIDSTSNARGKTIVAKCTVRIKLHVTYKSAIMQWVAYNDYNGGDNHYDIKLYNPNTGGIYSDESGVWYQYSKYYSYLR